ncbi:MAG: sulfatase-like hydrolase/transferase, partial [Victivallales bacterium]|nr:sulfatase-like hydrolase/transferase [Victivallales bacterium]
GMLNNTFVVFSADHGEMLGDHNLWRKTYAYEASSRVPFIVCPPNSIDCRRNVECPKPVGLEDIMPTFLAAAGEDIPDTVEGLDMLPLLVDEDAEWRDIYHGEHSPCYAKDNAQHFVTDGQWKFIWNPITGHEELFHLAEDPDECHNLAADPQHADTRAAFYNHMVRELDNRDEGFSDGRSLSTAPYPVWRGANPNDVHLG